MSKRNKLAAAYSETNDLLDEMKAIFEAQGYDFDECAVDEVECVSEFGEDIFRLFQLYTEMKTIIEA
jgi:hypothetical protein